MDHLWVLPLAAIGSAFGRRSAGGGLSAILRFNLGDLPVRLLWGHLVALGVYGVSHNLIASGLTWAGIWAGSCWGYGKTGMQLGRGPDPANPPTLPAWLRDASQLLLHGFLGVLGPALVFVYFDHRCPWPFLLAALACPLVYEFAYRFPLHVPVLGCLRTSPCPTAELVWGAAVGLAVAGAYL